MAEFKIVISTKDGKSEQKEVKDDLAKPFLGKKIGDTVKGDSVGMPGYEFEITGGSDDCGFPMRKDVSGTGRKRILAVSGVGLKKKRKGQRTRKTVCGNSVHSKISQLNLKVLKEGKKQAPKEEKADAPEEKGEKPKETPKEKPKAEEKKEEKPEEKKEEPKAEEKKEEVKEEKKEEPAKDSKEETKPEEKKE